MSPHLDPETAFAAARPDDPSPGSAVDVRQAVREGYRARRRRRAVLGGATATGVCAVAAVLALSVTGLPAAEPEPREFAAGEEFGFDPATAGYPEAEFGHDWAAPQPALQEAADAVFGPLAIEAGILEDGDLDYELPSDAAIQDMMDEHGFGYFDALSEMGYQHLPLHFDAWSVPAADGQVFLRGFMADDGEDTEHPAFTVTALQPGGWTIEPGPTGPALFPQHLISDQASWTEEAPEFTSEDLEDGRTIMLADHGCALEAAVVYPNGSALTSTWDLDCHGQGREMTVEQLREAMLAMPQIEYDTSELAPAEALPDFPPAWAYDADWETEAAADAQASIDAATATLDAVHPGMEVTSSGPAQLETASDQAQRSYFASYNMPFEDASGYPVHASVWYHLPGGWLAGLTPEGSTAEVYLIGCESEKDDVCEETEVDGRTVATRTFSIGATTSTWVAVFDPAGWAVVFETMAEGPLDDYAYDDLVALALALPAPVYDAEEYDR
ncbi:hypothetical protein [Glycomyces sp. NPDC021274]|uniref:hypothetical protein n=1 Tax=Glycomyces sp. NPDC021274 TaxID=3155120 RepID=UPI0033C86EBE